MCQRRRCLTGRIRKKILSIDQECMKLIANQIFIPGTNMLLKFIENKVVSSSARLQALSFDKN